MTNSLETLGDKERNVEIHYPDGLTQTDIGLIKKQCELQHATSKEQLEGFARAYKKAKDLASNPEQLSSLSAEQLENLILELAELTETRNQKGYRRVPVTFASGGSALNPDVIPRAIESFCAAYAEKLMDPVKAYTEFERIHPFEDGNGRVGDLLWKLAIARETGTWPEELPPDVFGVHQDQT